MEYMLMTQMTLSREETDRESMGERERNRQKENEMYEMRMRMVYRMENSRINEPINLFLEAVGWYKNNSVWYSVD